MPRRHAVRNLFYRAARRSRAGLPQCGSQFSERRLIGTWRVVQLPRFARQDDLTHVGVFLSKAREKSEKYCPEKRCSRPVGFPVGPVYENRPWLPGALIVRPGSALWLRVRSAAAMPMTPSAIKVFTSGHKNRSLSKNRSSDRALTALVTVECFETSSGGQTGVCE